MPEDRPEINTPRRFEAKPLNEVSGDFPKELIEQLSEYRKFSGPEMVKVIHSLADIMGPLTVKERWDLLGDYNLESLRRNVNLVGSSADAARGVLEGAFRRLYPTTVYAFTLIDKNTNSSPFSPEMKALIGALVVENPTIPE